MKKILLMTLLAVFSMFANAAEFKWKLAPSAPHIRLSADGKSYSGEVRVYNGKNKKYDRLTGKISNGNLVLSANGYTLTLKPQIKGNILLFNAVLVNQSSKELFLQPELSFTVPASEKYFFFNGYETLDTKTLPIRREGLKGRPNQKLAGVTQVFPAAALIGKKYTLFAGEPPHELISYHAAILEKNDSNCYRFTFNQRHAIAAGKSVDFKMLTGVTATRYGKEEAMVQRMFDAFPELFAPVVSHNNPYIWGTEQYLESWNQLPDYELERRYHASLTWAFVPFKRAGDIYGEADLWEYKPHTPFKWYYNTRIAGEIFDYRNLSHEKFHTLRKKVFNKYAKDFGYAFYNSAAGVWCENQLAVSRYPDSIVDDTDKVAKYLSPWCTPWDQHVRVFSYGTSFGKKFREDTKKIHADLGMPGFALDCVTPGAYYRGPASKNPDMPGRAWDEKGVFIDQTVAIIKITDFIHDELPETFVWLNGITGKGDTTMLEYGIFEDNFRSVMPVVRYNAGMIPMQTRGYGYTKFLYNYLPDWRNMSKEEFKSELEKLSVHLIFNYFQYGLTGTYNTANGFALEQYIMPELLELRKIGWQAQVPLKVDSQKLFYSARYGRGENSVIFMGNPYETGDKCSAEIGNDILGKDNYIWVRKMRDSATTVNCLKSRTTIFSADLLSRLPVLYESVCGLSNIPADGINVTVSSQKDINKIIFRLKFKDNKVFSTALNPRKIEDFTLDKIILNGKTVDSEKITIPANAEITIEYKSDNFTFSNTDLMRFPFADNSGKIVMQILLPQDANASELRQAERLAGVFKFLADKKAVSGADVKIVRSDNSDKAAFAVAVGRSADKAQVSLQGNVWKISAPDAASADKLVRKFSYIIDKRFEYIFPFKPRAWDCLNPEMLNYFDLTEEYLPFVRCFENKGVK